MHRDEAIEVLLGMKRLCITDDLDSTIRAGRDHDAIDVAVRDIAFCNTVGQDREPQRFGRWKRVPAGMTPGGTPMYACAQCGGTEHLQGAEYPGRKVLCDDCGCVNFYPWDKLIDVFV